MNWLSILMWILTNAPDLVAIIQAIINIFSRNQEKRELVRLELSSLITEANKSRDVGPVRARIKRLAAGL